MWYDALELGSHIFLETIVYFILAISVLLIFRSAFKSVERCSLLLKKIQSIPSEEKIMLLDHLSKAEKNFFQSLGNKLSVKKLLKQTSFFFIFSLILFSFGIIHIFYVYINFDYSSGKVLYNLLCLISFQFALYIFHAVVTYWRLSNRIIHKYALILKPGNR
jgi:Na+/melibiose symporter-like transporter